MSDLYSKTRYNSAPTIGHRRTRFDLSHSILTTFNNGEFVPVLTEFINPGETVELKYSSLTRLETSLHQTMDNAYVEFAFFATPIRILWTSFKYFEGENDDPWAQLTNYTVPQLLLTGSNSAEEVTPGSLLNHLMLPAGNYGSGPSNKSLSVEQLSLRNVFEIYNQWYRNQNYDSIIYYSKDGTDKILSNGYLFNGSYFTPRNSNLKVNRLRDRFSTVLPAPQKGQEISFGLNGGYAPVVAPSNTLHSTINAIQMSNPTVEALANGAVYDVIGQKVSLPGGGNAYSVSSGSPSGTSADNAHAFTKTNLAADLSAATAVTVNQLRLAIVRQAMLERDARAGTRLNEIISSRWDVHAKSLELDRPEFLGGKRIPLSMMEVLQTSETGTTVLGSDAGHSKTVDHSDGFVKSFTQHMILQGFMYARTARSYSQGIDRMHFIKDYLDMPDPMLDRTGEVGVYKKELYSLASSNNSAVEAADGIAGYQEQYYWIKERINRFSGYFQPGISGTLDSWHYGDDYNALPTISASWMKEPTSNVDRTIAVSSNAAFQYSANVYFEFYVTRPFAKYSIPNNFGF